MYPEIMGGKGLGSPQEKPEVLAFFTGRDPGVEISGLTDMEAYCPVQEHTGTVYTLENGSSAPVVADAVITKLKDVLLCIKVADCVPVLIYDPTTRAVGAVHAGWKGTEEGILKNTVREMASAFGTRARDIRVAIGPAIRWCCYKVGQDVLDAVVKATGKGDYHKERDGQQCLDLQSANKYQALSVKIPEQNIQVVEECTFCYPDRFYSWRYAPGEGRQGGFIGLAG